MSLKLDLAISPRLRSTEQKLTVKDYNEQKDGVTKWDSKETTFNSIHKFFMILELLETQYKIMHHKYLRK